MSAIACTAVVLAEDAADRVEGMAVGGFSSDTRRHPNQLRPAKRVGGSSESPTAERLRGAGYGCQLSPVGCRTAMSSDGSSVMIPSTLSFAGWSEARRRCMSASVLTVHT